MAILTTDITYRLSGGAANADPALSIGGAKSSVSMGTDLMPLIASMEAAAGSVKYRCIYLNNAHGTLTAELAKLWIQANTPSPGTDLAIGVGASAINGTETAIANQNTAPAGVTFSAAADEASAIALGNIPAGQHRAVWIRLTTTAGVAAANGDGGNLRFKCDTAA